MKVTAYALRFVAKAKKTNRNTGILSSTEIEDAERLWIVHIQEKHFHDVRDNLRKQRQHQLITQLGLYQDEKGIIRCGGRLQLSELSEAAKKPILLPRQEQFTRLVVIDQHERSLHAGVSQTLSSTRQKYWITHGRATVKSVLGNCRVCRRHEGGPYKMPVMPQLPAKRVTESPAFTYTGIDYLGPIYIKSGQEHKKVWVCLFTCLVTRAIHLELIMDLTTEQFLLGLRRFIARRGKPDEITSDNAAHFKLASSVLDKMWNDILTDKDVQTYVSDKNIKWKFIIELAPWMGGYYERMVGLVKRSLRKAIGRACLTCEQLETYLLESEAVINSRPITYVGDDIDSTFPLTPAHFLSMNPRVGIPHCETPDNDDTDYVPVQSTAEKLLDTWKKGQKHLNKFWSIWRTDYLTSLRERYQSKLKSTRVQYPGPPGVGDVVLIKDDLPRACWKIGRIAKLVTSRDGEVRSARVRLPSGRTIGRALKMLYPVECPTNTGDPEEPTPKTNQDQKDDVENRIPLRKPRKAAKRAKTTIRRWCKELSK